MTSIAWTVRWAVVPFSPAAPFRIYAGPDHAPYELGLERLLASPAAGADTELTFLTPGKVRPVLCLSDPPARLHNEVTALRLLRLSKLSERQQGTIRRHGDELLFHLPPERFDLPEENAVIVSALVRVIANAVSEESLGELDPQERRVLAERIIRFYRFDTHALVEQRLQQLARLTPRRHA